MMMDSGNSSSMQSSSGADDQEYDSTTFFHKTPPPPQTTASLIFSPDTNFLHPFSDLRDPVFNYWPNCGSDDVAHPNYLSFPAAGGEGSSSSSALPPPPPQPPTTAAAAPPPPPKNPKKRTRASRRAPTTVITTDTSNFRTMVQQYTGIPGPPFSAAASSAYSRLLGAPFRPAAQRPTPQSSVFSSSLLNMGGGQSQLSGSGHHMGLPKLPGQPEPVLTFQTLFQQQQEQSNSSQLITPPHRLLGYQQDLQSQRNIQGHAAFGSINDESSNIYSNTNNNNKEK